MLATRIPVPRLVDWIDQAILYRHTVDETGEAIGRKMLRAAGIRTASDLVAVHASADLWQSLASLGADSWGSPAQLDLLIAAIEDDEWMVNVLEWRKDRPPGQQTITISSETIDISSGISTRRDLQCGSLGTAARHPACGAATFVEVLSRQVQCLTAPERGPLP